MTEVEIKNAIIDLLDETVSESTAGIARDNFATELANIIAKAINESTVTVPLSPGIKCNGTACTGDNSTKWGVDL
jgi:hypothetical protein